MIFDEARQNLREYLNIHPLLTQVVLAKNAKVEKRSRADVDYHLDVDFKVKEERHEVKLKLFTTKCRIQVQHAGKRACNQYEHLDKLCRPKYVAEKIVMAFCEKAYGD